MTKAYQIINGQIWEFSYFKLTPSHWVDANNKQHRKRSKVFKTWGEAQKVLNGKLRLHDKSL